MSKSLKYNKNLGFTLLEVLLSVAIITLIAGLGTPIYQAFQVRNDLDVATNTISQSLRRAQVLSQSVDGDSSWGLYVQNGEVALFQGVSYASRNTSFDEVFDLPGSITPSGISEIVYSKFTGEPQVTGTITLTSSTNETRNITINEKGMIDTSSPIDLPSPDVLYEYSIYSDWSEGYCVNVSVVTESEEPVVWEAVIDLSIYPLNGTPYNVWNADWTFSGDTLTASGAGWNDTVSVDSPQEFGFCANRPVAPFGEVSYVVTVTSDWGTGYCAIVDVTTESVTPVTWEVIVALNAPPTNGTPYNVWNADWTFSGDTLTASGAGWNDEVLSGQPRQFGYCANR